MNTSAHGFVDLGGSIARWLARVPLEVRRDLDVELPGSPLARGSDYASFVCRGAPGLAALPAASEPTPKRYRMFDQFSMRVCRGWSATKGCEDRHGEGDEPSRPLA